MRSIHRFSSVGFTVVEVLVATLIMGIIGTALLSLTRDTLQYTGLSGAISVAVEDIADTEGYLSDTLRNAKAVFAAIHLVAPDGSTVIDCDLAVNGNCIAVLSPVQDTSNPTLGQPIINFDLSVFSIERIGNRYAADGLGRGWQGEDTLTLFEYRIPSICPSTCDVAPGTLSPSQTTWTGTVGVLLTGLAAIDGDGNPVEFFSQPTSASLLITLVARANAAASQPFVVRRTPVALHVTVRD